MKRSWRRFLVTVATIVVVLLLMLTGVALWLYHSGRLAVISTRLVHSLSGQDISIDTITFPSWNTVVFTDVHFHTSFPGWQLDILCPRVEARVGLRGLLNQHVETLLVEGFQVVLQARDVALVTSSAPTPSVPAGLTPVPITQLTARHGQLSIRSAQRQYTWHDLDIRLQQHAAQTIQLDLRGNFEELLAPVRVTTHLDLGTSQLSAQVHITATALSLSELAQVLPGIVPETLQTMQGNLDVESQLTVQGETVHGHMTTTVTDLTTHISGVHIEQSAVSFEGELTGNIVQPMLSMTGQLQGQTATVLPNPGTTITKVNWSTPIQAFYTTDHWQVHTRQGRLQGHWQENSYAFMQLTTHLEPRVDGGLSLQVSGQFETGEAPFQVTVQTAVEASKIVHTMQANVQRLPLTVVAAALPGVFIGQTAQGTLNVDGELTQQGESIQGTVTAALAQVTTQIAGVHIEQGTGSTSFDLSGNTAPWRIRLQGQARLQAKRVTDTAQGSVTNVVLSTPWQLTFAADGWQATSTLSVAGDVVQVSGAAQGRRLSGTVPLQIQATAAGLRFQCTPALKLQTLTVSTTGTPLQIRDLRSHFTIKARPTVWDITEIRLQTQDWSRANEPTWLTQLSVRGAATLDLSRQRLAVSAMTATLANLGTLQASGIWHWPEHMMQDVSLQLVPEAAAPWWPRLAGWLPKSLRAWEVAGGMELTMQSAQLSLRTLWEQRHVQLRWQLHNMTASSATYGAEQLNGTLQSTVAFDASSGRYTVQGQVVLQPFAFLVGNLFVDLTPQGLAPTLTFSAVYDRASADLQLSLSGDMGVLGRVTLEGAMQQPSGTPQYVMQLQILDVQAEHVQRTFLHDPQLFPMLAAGTLQGKVNARLQIRGQAGEIGLQGQLNINQASLLTPAIEVRGLSLALPLQGQYPLPRTVPAANTRPLNAYGQLTIAGLRLGGVDVGGLRTRLALWSDTLLVPDQVSLTMLGGQVDITALQAQRLLQPERYIGMHLRLRQLNLQHIQRGTEALPVAGIINGELTRLQISGGHLDTAGALDISLAGGRLRVYDIRGRDMFSGFPTWQASIRTEEPLSLLQLTRLYPIGEMSGTVDIELADLTLIAGEPVNFRLQFAIRERGGEKREITLRALNNLLFTTGSARVAAGLFGIGDTYRLPYRRFGANAVLNNDVLRLRGLYHGHDGTEYFMQAPAFGHGVEVINQVPENGTSFRAFMQRLRSTVLDKPNVQLK